MEKSKFFPDNHIHVTEKECDNWENSSVLKKDEIARKLRHCSNCREIARRNSKELFKFYAGERKRKIRT